MRIIYNQTIGNNNCSKDKIECEKEIKSKNSKTYIYDLNVVNEYNYISKSIDLSLDEKCREKYLDIQMDKVKYTKVCGVVKDREDNVVKDKKITLFKATLVNYKTEYIPICDMVTDDNGRYETFIKDDNGENHYIVRD